MVEIKKVTTLNCIEKDDFIVITGQGEVDSVKLVSKVKVSEADGTEIIFDLKKNLFFNLGMYLEGKSWVKDLRVIKRVYSDSELSESPSEEHEINDMALSIRETEYEKFFNELHRLSPDSNDEFHVDTVNDAFDVLFPLFDELASLRIKSKK